VYSFSEGYWKEKGNRKKERGERGRGRGTSSIPPLYHSGVSITHNQERMIELTIHAHQVVHYTMKTHLLNGKWKHTYQEGTQPAGLPRSHLLWGDHQMHEQGMPSHVVFLCPLFCRHPLLSLILVRSFRSVCPASPIATGLIVASYSTWRQLWHAPRDKSVQAFPRFSYCKRQKLGMEAWEQG